MFRIEFITFAKITLTTKTTKSESDEDTYYIPFGIMGFDLGDDFYDRYSDYKGYIKVVRNYKNEKYYIAIYNDKYGMAEVSQKDLRKNKVSIKEELITEVPQNTIVCHKN